MLMLLDASTSSGSTTTTSGGMTNWVFWIMLILIVVVFYFLVIRPQKKQEKEQNDMKNSLQVGDEITTIGGIVGCVVKVKDDIFTIVTSKDRTRISFSRFALRSIDRRAGEAYDPKKAKAEEKAAEAEKTDDKSSESSENK